MSTVKDKIIKIVTLTEAERNVILKAVTFLSTVLMASGGIKLFGLSLDADSLNELPSLIFSLSEALLGVVTAGWALVSWFGNLKEETVSPEEWLGDGDVKSLSRKGFSSKTRKMYLGIFPTI